MGTLIGLFSAPPTGSEPPAAQPALSPARDALARHYRALAAALAAVEPLRVAAVALAAAEQREAQAQATVDAVAKIEQGALELWTTAPDGPLPAPRTAEREQALAHLADAHAAAVIARRAAAAVAPALDAAHRRYCDLASRTPALRRSVEIEVAAELTEAYAATARRLVMLEAAICGVIDSRRADDDGGAMTAIRRWMVAGPHVPMPEYERCQHFDRYRRETLALCQRHREAGRALGARLGRDPQATIVIDDDDAPRGAGEAAA